jgi:hypothetical protein
MLRLATSQTIVLREQAMSEHSSSAPRDAAAPKMQGSNAWDKVPALLAALNPVLLLVIGVVLNSGIERTKASIDLAKIEIEKTKAQIEVNSAGLRDLKTTAETATIAVHDRVDKVKVISDFLNDLSGPDERRRSLAIEAIFIALPEEAARLVKVVEKFAKSGDHAGDKDVVAAKDALASTRDRLVADMFSSVRQTRTEALSTLERGWTNDAPIVDLLIGKAMTDIQARQAAKWAKPTPGDDKAYQQLASIYNVVEFLSTFRASVDAAQKSRIAKFLAAAEPNSDDTKRIVAMLKERFQ